jgi:hypothetical protein
LRLDTIIVADAAAQAGGKLSILGAWTSRLTPTTFPWTEPSLSVVVRASLEDEDYERDHDVSIGVEGPDGQAGMPSQFHLDRSDLQAMRAALVPNEQHAVVLASTFMGATFKSAGLYHVVVRFDGKEVGRYPLPVIENSS